MSLITRLGLVVLSFLFSTACVYADKYNFLGALIENKMVPSSYWSHGLNGYKCTVVVLEDKSPAIKYGFMPNDLILKIDGENLESIKKILDLEDGVHKIQVFRKKEFVNLEVLIQKKVKTSTPVINNSSNLPAIQVNTDYLEKKYGINDKTKKSKKRSYQQCMEDEMASADTYEYYLNNPNTGYGYQRNRNSLDYKRARKICDEESDAVKVIIMNY